MTRLVLQYSQDDLGIFNLASGCSYHGDEPILWDESKDGLLPNTLIAQWLQACDEKNPAAFKAAWEAFQSQGS